MKTGFTILSVFLLIPGTIIAVAGGVAYVKIQEEDAARDSRDDVTIPDTVPESFMTESTSETSTPEPAA